MKSLIIISLLLTLASTPLKSMSVKLFPNAYTVPVKSIEDINKHCQQILRKLASQPMKKYPQGDEDEVYQAIVCNKKIAKLCEAIVDADQDDKSWFLQRVKNESNVESEFIILQRITYIEEDEFTLKETLQRINEIFLSIKKDWILFSKDDLHNFVITEEINIENDICLIKNTDNKEIDNLIKGIFKFFDIWVMCNRTIKTRLLNVVEEDENCLQVWISPEDLAQAYKYLPFLKKIS